MGSDVPARRRILSVDVLRGLTVACMILVNNGYGESFAQLRHSVWNGLTLSDMVFPSFLFIMGLSVNLSRRQDPGRILWRAAAILLLGWAVYYVEFALAGDFLPWDHFRLTGVLPRIALCYLGAALLSRRLRTGVLAGLAGVLLALYAVLLWLGDGYACAESSVLCRVDRFLLGAPHLYRKSVIDPEGLLSTVPSLAHTLLGCVCGRLLVSQDPLSVRLRRIALYGLLLAAAGFGLHFLLPFNKRIWSPSFALFTSGCCALLLAGLAWLVDGKGLRRWTPFFTAFGRNALAVYVLSELLSAVFSHTGLSGALYGVLGLTGMPAPWTSLAYALCIVLLNYAAAWILYKKDIFIKV